MNELYTLAAQGELGYDPGIYFSDKTLAEKAARAWNVMAAIHDPDAVSISRYEVEAITEDHIIKDQQELIKWLRKL